MNKLKVKFERWYRLTCWMYEESWLNWDNNRYTKVETQAMFIAYCAGYNRKNKELKNVNRR